VIVDLEVLLQVVNEAEHLADGLLLSGHSNSHVVTIHLKEFKPSKGHADSLHNSVLVLLGVQLFSKEVGGAY
jgi:hypothetical protein